MLKILPFLLLYVFFSISVKAQSKQEKAQALVNQYLNKKENFTSRQNIKFNPIQVLGSSFSNTKQYKIFTHKIDSLKLEGRKIDARIPKMKTTAELNQAKKDSKYLSDQLVTTSDRMIEFMTEYKGTQTGWMIKSAYRTKTSLGNLKTVRKKIYLNLGLTKVDSVK